MAASLHLCDECSLRSNPAFVTGTPQEIAFVQHLRHDQKIFKAGAVVILPGTAPGFVYTLRQGWAFRYRLMSDGRRQILNFLLPGDLIGLQQEVTGVCDFGVEALTDLVLCRFEVDRLWEVYQNFPQLGHGLTWMASHEEWILEENLVSVGRRTALERVAMMLIHLHKRASSLGFADQAGAVPFPVNQQHLADALGLSLVHVNKTLRRLRQMGLYELVDDKLSLPQPHVIQRLADYYNAVIPKRPLL